MEPKKSYCVIGLDIESLAIDSKTKDSSGRATEVVFGKGGSLETNRVQVAGALIRQLYCQKFMLDDDFNVTEETSLLLNIDNQKTNLSAEAVEYAKEHHFWDLPNTISSETALREFLKFVPTGGNVVFVAYNGTRFDFPVLGLWFQRYFRFLHEGPNYMAFDALVELRKDLSGVVKHGFKLSNVYKEVTGKDLMNAHTADVDTKAMFEIMCKVYKTPAEMFKKICETSSKWNPNISQSLYRLSVKGDPKRLYLSRAAVFALEANGWRTCAAIVYAFENGQKLESLAKLSEKDIAILKEYCEAHNKKTSNASPDVTPNDVSDLSDAMSNLKVTNDLVIADREKKGFAKVPGCAKGFIDAFYKKHNRKPQVGDLVGFVSESKGDPEKFRKIMEGISPSINKENTLKTWKWLINK